MHREKAKHDHLHSPGIGLIYNSPYSSADVRDIALEVVK